MPPHYGKSSGISHLNYRERADFCFLRPVPVPWRGRRWMAML
jgi:hypothetical protein